MFVIIYLLLYFSLLCFYKTKSKTQQSRTCTTRSQSALQTVGQHKHCAEAQGSAQVWPGLQTFLSSIFNFKKIKQNKNQQRKQIQNLYNNTRTSVLLQYTPKIKYPSSSTQGSKDMTKSPKNKAVKVNQHRQSPSFKCSSKQDRQ